MTDKTRDELEHEAIQAQIAAILIQVNANFEVMNVRLSDILDETKRTNGRVTKIESDTDFIRLLKKYKWLLSFVILGVWAMFQLMDMEKIMKIIKLL